MTDLAQPSLLDWTPPASSYGGATYDPARDGPRLNRQASAVYAVMADGAWRTLREIAEATKYPEASISARLRDLKKPEFYVQGTVEKEYLADGLWRYRLLLSKGNHHAPQN
jgi:hypothetical protein